MEITVPIQKSDSLIKNLVTPQDTEGDYQGKYYQRIYTRAWNANPNHFVILKP